MWAAPGAGSAPSFAGVGEPVPQGDWGGTSFTAPQLSGSAAVINSFAGHRVGFWNPASYAFATSGRSPFTALSQARTSNDNLFYTGNRGQPYNPGSGLGYPNLGALAAEFASLGG
jgi:subtilase family serine protease